MSAGGMTRDLFGAFVSFSAKEEGGQPIFPSPRASSSWLLSLLLSLYVCISFPSTLRRGSDPLSSRWGWTVSGGRRVRHGGKSASTQSAKIPPWASSLHSWAAPDLAVAARCVVPWREREWQEERAAPRLEE